MALLIIPVLKWWSRARGPYGYLRTWNWPITAREISQPYNNYFYTISIVLTNRDLVIDAIYIIISKCFCVFSSIWIFISFLCFCDWPNTTDPFTVSVAILEWEQSRQKLQQLYGKWNARVLRTGSGQNGPAHGSEPLSSPAPVGQSAEIWRNVAGQNVHTSSLNLARTSYFLQHRTHKYKAASANVRNVLILVLVPYTKGLSILTYFAGFCGQRCCSYLRRSMRVRWCCRIRTSDRTVCWRRGSSDPRTYCAGKHNSVFVIMGMVFLFYRGCQKPCRGSENTNTKTWPFSCAFVPHFPRWNEARRCLVTRPVSLSVCAIINSRIDLGRRHKDEHRPFVLVTSLKPIVPKLQSNKRQETTGTRQEHNVNEYFLSTGFAQPIKALSFHRANDMLGYTNRLKNCCKKVRK